MYALLVIFLIGCSLPSLAMNSWGSVDDHDRVNNTLIQQQLTTLQSLGVKLKNNGLVIPLKRGNQIALALALSGSQELLAGHDVHLDYFDQLSQDHVPLLRCLPKLVSLKLYTSNLDAAKGRILSDILDHHRSKLTSLDLSQYVKLTDDGLIALQQSMNSLPHLKVISLNMQETFSNTGFLTLSSILPNLISLEELDLGEMKIGAQRETQFLSHLSKLTNLKKLDVSYNELTGNFLIFLKPLSRLMNLNVRCNLITGKKLRLFPKSKFKDSLTILNISGNQIDDEGFSHITTLPNLSTLNIEHNGITDEGVIEVIDLHSLTFLDISCNKISDDGVKVFLENSQIELSINWLRQDPTPTSLCLRGKEVGPIEIQAVARSTGLTSLVLQGCDIGILGAQTLAQNTTLTSLNLLYNNITDGGIQTVAKNTTLISLSLDSNQISPLGAQALAQNTTLTSLHLCNNNVGDMGAQALAKNTTLISLNLDSNQISLLGAQALAQNTTLTSLHLRNNNVGDVGAQALAQKTNLKFLDLCNNNIGINVKAQILQQNKTLKSLILYGDWRDRRERDKN